MSRPHQKKRHSVKKVIKPSVPLPEGSWWSCSEKGILLHLWVQPRASSIGWKGGHGGSLKLSLTAAPVDDDANQQCLEFLAKTLRLPRSQITLVRGKTSRHKWIRIEGISVESWRAWSQLIEQASPLAHPHSLELND